MSRNRQRRGIYFVAVGALVLGCNIGSPSDGAAGGPGQPGGPGEPPGQSVVFQSNWSSATGTGEGATGDGGKWPNFYCGPESRARVLSVVPGAPHGWTLTPNVLQVTNAGSENCALLENVTAIPANADNYYVRLYIRVVNVANGGFTFHSVKMSAFSPMQTTYWGIDHPVTNSTYRPRFRMDEYEGMATYGYVGPQLTQGAWYRFEYHVEFHNPAAPLRFRVWPRVYDMNGDLVADATGYISNDDGPTTTLAQHYNSGGYGVAESRDRTRHIALGYEGTGGNEDVGARWYYAGLEVRTDRFPGPIQ